MLPKPSALVLVFTLVFAANNLTACSEGAEDASGGGGSGGADATGGSGADASVENQCGVAAPLPAETGQCTRVSEPTLTDFDDYAGTAAGSYTYSVHAVPPAADLLGAILHVADGSDANGGTAVIATEMITGEGDAGYALQISNTNAMNWGGLLMFYFPSGAATAACLDARDFEGVEFSIKGSAPSGRFGVSVGMLDTIPIADHGLCDNPSTSDCLPASIELELPADAATWTQVRVPWSAFTPGVGSGTACVPVTGQNIVRLVIQPFMTYPPPDYMFEPGAYAIAVDNVRFH